MATANHSKANGSTTINTVWALPDYIPTPLRWRHGPCTQTTNPTSSAPDYTPGEEIRAVGFGVDRLSLLPNMEDGLPIES